MTIRIWNAATGETVAGPFRGHTDSVRSIAFSPDGQHVASGSGDRTIRIWNVATGKTVAGPFNGHSSWVRSVAFSPDGQQVASGSQDCTIRVWNVATGLIDTGFSEPVTFTDQSIIDKDGWIRGEGGEHLLWIPELHRLSLHRPSNIWVGGKNETRLNLRRFVHGTKWADCYVKS